MILLMNKMVHRENILSSAIDEISWVRYCLSTVQLTSTCNLYQLLPLGVVFSVDFDISLWNIHGLIAIRYYRGWEV